MHVLEWFLYLEPFLENIQTLIHIHGQGRCWTVWQSTDLLLLHLFIAIHMVSHSFLRSGACFRCSNTTCLMPQQCRRDCGTPKLICISFTTVKNVQSSKCRWTPTVWDSPVCQSIGSHLICGEGLRTVDIQVYPSATVDCSFIFVNFSVWNWNYKATVLVIFGYRPISAVTWSHDLYKVVGKGCTPCNVNKWKAAQYREKNTIASCCADGRLYIHCGYPTTGKMVYCC